jgi:hypothetical protein
MPKRILESESEGETSEILKKRYNEDFNTGLFFVWELVRFKMFLEECQPKSNFGQVFFSGLVDHKGILSSSPFQANPVTHKIFMDMENGITGIVIKNKAPIQDFLKTFKRIYLTELHKPEEVIRIRFGIHIFFKLCEEISFESQKLIKIFDPFDRYSETLNNIFRRWTEIPSNKKALEERYPNFEQLFDQTDQTETQADQEDKNRNVGEAI